MNSYQVKVPYEREDLRKIIKAQKRYRYYRRQKIWEIFCDILPGELSEYIIINEALPMGKDQEKVFKCERLGLESPIVQCNKYRQCKHCNDNLFSNTKEKINKGFSVDIKTHSKIKDLSIRHGKNYSDIVMDAVRAYDDNKFSIYMVKSLKRCCYRIDTREDVGERINEIACEYNAHPSDILYPLIAGYWMMLAPREINVGTCS